MPRSGRLRNYIREIAESPRAEKLSFIPPFLILIVEIALLHHAVTTYADQYVINLIVVLLIISIIEIFLVMREIHEHYQRSNFDRELTIRLDDYITERKTEKVKKIVEDFIDVHPDYGPHRTEIYHIACQIMDTLKEKAWEKALTDKLKKFIKRRKKMNVGEILKAFIKKYPTYKKYRAKIYHIACQIMGVPEEDRENTFND